MGASSWHYVTEITENPNEALQRLRDEVFESGRYGDPVLQTELWKILPQMSWTAKLLIMGCMAFYWASSFMSWVARGCRKPQTIEEALEIAAEAGTHSILDIRQCSLTPDFGVAFPLSPARRRRLFGTESPTAEDLERVGWMMAGEDLERWHAVYFPLYQEGQPIKLVFVGCSGD